MPSWLEAWQDGLREMHPVDWAMEVETSWAGRGGGWRVAAAVVETLNVGRLAVDEVEVKMALVCGARTGRFLSVRASLVCRGVGILAAAAAEKAGVTVEVERKAVVSGAPGEVLRSYTFRLLVLVPAIREMDLGEDHLALVVHLVPIAS